MTAIDWPALSRAFRQAQIDVQNECTWRGNEYYAEVLRRTLQYRPADEQFPYESVRAPGLITTAESDYTRDAHLAVERVKSEHAQQGVPHQC